MEHQDHFQDRPTGREPQPETPLQLPAAEDEHFLEEQHGMADLVALAAQRYLERHRSERWVAWVA